MTLSGTGKTYAAAFAMRELNQEKVLFLVHREQIAKQAQKSFRKVLGSKVSYGIISGNQKEPDADYLFATVQTMSRDETLTNFSKHQFQTIIIDAYGIIGTTPERLINQAISGFPYNFQPTWESVTCKFS